MNKLMKMCENEPTLAYLISLHLPGSQLGVVFQIAQIKKRKTKSK